MKELTTAETVLSNLRLLIDTHQIIGNIIAVQELSYSAGKLAGVSWGDEWGEAKAIQEAKAAIEKHRLPPYEKNLSPDHPTVWTAADDL